MPDACPIRVLNLADHTEVLYLGPTPREAVRNAWALFTRRDGNSWTYSKYDHLVQEGKYSFICGDWATLKDPRPKTPAATPKGGLTQGVLWLPTPPPTKLTQGNLFS